ncbi:glycosyltransferase [Methylomonas albis]|uniref:glycosyltransferase n=1 Tax=Methylomonas albis TaxID=1854563 RepID=UPI001CAA8A46|nr:glycosyltransferase [Methylomonas albis]
MPYYLAQQGHDITLLLLDYHAGDPIYHHAHGIKWFSVSVQPLKQASGPMAYLRQAEKIVNTQTPDWIIGFSDTWYGILAAYLGKRYGVKTLIDAYDNYESYIPWFKPLHWLWRHSLRRCTAVSAAGPQLAKLMARSRADNVSTVIPMTADPIFHPLNDCYVRNRFNLPNGVPLIGYCGSLYENRGVETLFQAMRYLVNQLPEAKLVISGRREQGIKIPIDLRHAVIELGYLADDDMPLLINALDVLVVINRHSAFGEYSYPVKLYEAMHCQKPVIASDSAGAKWILQGHPECLADSGDSVNFAKRIHQALSWKTKEYNSSHDWAFSSKLFKDLLGH